MLMKSEIQKGTEPTERGDRFKALNWPVKSLWFLLPIVVLGFNVMGCNTTEQGTEVAGDGWTDVDPHVVTDTDIVSEETGSSSGDTGSGDVGSTDSGTTGSGSADSDVDSGATTTGAQVRDPKRTNPLATIPKDPKKTVNITFDDLAFEMEKGGDFERSMLTEHINLLNQRTVKVRGYIKPTNRSSGIRKFVFVRDDKECCFGPQAAIFDNILVTLKKGKELDYTVRPITLEGKLKLVEWRGPDEKIWSIYQMKSGEKK